MIALLLNVTLVSAKELNPRKNYAKTTEELTELLIPSSGMEALESDVKVTVRVMCTASGEIIVLEANTDNEVLASYIKDTLNYKKLTSNEIEAGSDYAFVVLFKA